MPCTSSITINKIDNSNYAGNLPEWKIETFNN